MKFAKITFIGLLTSLLLVHLSPASLSAFKKVDKMPEKQLISLFNQYIKDTVRVRELAIRKKENILSHKVLNVKKLTKEISEKVVDVSNFERLGRDYLVFYTAVDYNLSKESKYRLNGINYRLMIMVQAPNKEWDFFRYDTAPVNLLVKLGQGFGTDDESQMAQIEELRNQGKYVNRKGEEVGDLYTDNAAMESDLLLEMGEATANSIPKNGKIPDAVNPNYKRPKWIRVVMTQPSNLKFYGCTKACVQRIDFFDYLKHVLPLEWIKEAPKDSLMAGALAIKMYAWHAVTVDPKARYTDADIIDTEANQVYAADFKSYFFSKIRKTNTSLTDQQIREISERESKLAVEVGAIFHAYGVAGVGVKENILNTLVDIGHKQDAAKGSGTISQTESIKLVNEQKLSFIDILEIFLEKAPSLPKGAQIELFRYAK
ncbi:SpoIID/LytB domain-containing protein [Paenibacillus sp. HWE-109]|uniref:SpoIID/LytB domain-containing protein n=1 Tax=Paenibacillus sp. HWE-109 TaxID=1306526 RepID=UPI001EDDFAE8|nr:SpoIID/LytB domain-containing protein [Paenibacillus sp. HWE-109]UKS25508.1 SpoIID/LytB domain-containing protein [Paenibacillus sp. HWE-109]